MDKKKHLPTSDFIRNAIRSNNKDSITIDELKISLHERGFGILMMFFSLPLSIPIPYIPGLTTILSLPLIIFSFQLILGMEYPWLPKWLLKKSIKRSFIAYLIIKSSPLLKKIEKILKHRLEFLTYDIGARIIGIFAFVFAIAIAVPLPFTNFIPAIGILLMSFGMLGKDGLITIIGALIGIIGLIVTFLILFLGKKIVFGIIYNIK